MYKILVVDDEVVVTMQLEQNLASMGYAVVGTASSGEEAIKMARLLKPDLILMDIVMPGKLDGIKASEIIKAELDIPVIFLTAYTDDELINRAKNTTPFGYIVKPFHNREIKAAIEVAMCKNKIDGELKESEERFRLAFENTNTGMCLLGLDGRLTRVNDRMCNILGYSQQELENMTLNDITHPEDLDISLQFIKQSISGEIERVEFQKRYIHKQGDVVWGQVSSSLVRTPKGDPLYFVSNVQDITEHKKAEEALRESEEKIQAILDASSDIIHLLDINGIILSSNHAFTKWFGLEVDTVIGKCVFDYGNPKSQPERRAALDKVFRTGEPLQFETTDTIGGDSVFESHFHPVFNPEGEVIAVAVYARDITERKKAEEEITKIKRLLLDAEHIGNMGSWEWNIIKDEFIFSDEWCRIHGVSLGKQLTNEELMLIAYDDDKDRVSIAFKNALDGISPYNIEHRIVGHDHRFGHWLKQRPGASIPFVLAETFFGLV